MNIYKKVATAGLIFAPGFVVSGLLVGMSGGADAILQALSATPDLALAALIAVPAVMSAGITYIMGAPVFRNEPWTLDPEERQALAAEDALASTPQPAETERLADEDLEQVGLSTGERVAAPTIASAVHRARKARHEQGGDATDLATKFAQPRPDAVAAVLPASIAEIGLATEDHDDVEEPAPAPSM